MEIPAVVQPRDTDSSVTFSGYNLVTSEQVNTDGTDSNGLVMASRYPYHSSPFRPLASGRLVAILMLFIVLSSDGEAVPEKHI